MKKIDADKTPCKPRAKQKDNEKQDLVKKSRPLQARNRYPKRSAYYASTKPRMDLAVPSTDVNNSSKAQKVSAKTTTSTQNKPKESPRKSSPKREASPTKIKPTPGENKSIFVTPAKNFTEIAADVIRADCMNHGYKIEKTIGEGAYAKVKLAEVLPSKLARNPEMTDMAEANDGVFHVAIKVIESKNVPKEFLKKFLPRELNNHCPLPTHGNVVQVFEQFKTNDRYYVVMEYCSKGDLLDLINQRISESCKGVGEDLARKMFRMMAEGVQHIHNNGIVHRDLKCENILLDKQDVVKITDFGFSTKFVPDKSNLLKTSCGSYAYTAPEVIKIKPYDGTKSDAWSLGVILFAMLNGRLPFNDAQLGDLEEDMKMQRLRFERTVSFESMVLVRRILQYNPASRPTLEEILNDPWLTGKRLIPRQSNKPKWINPYSPRKDEGDLGGATLVGTNPVYYKATIPERGPEATVTVNHEKNETVVLKSRTGNKKNIWTSGPPVSQRPNTWPRSDKSTQEQKSNRGTATSRRTSARVRKNQNTTVVVKQPDGPRQKPGKGDAKGRVSSKTIKLSKWFMEKYMVGKEMAYDKDKNGDCGCCKVEAIMKKRLDTSGDTDSDLVPTDIKDNDDQDDFRFPSPVKNMPDDTAVEVKTAKSKNEKADTKTAPFRKDIHIPKQTAASSRACSVKKSVSCGRRSATTTRKVPTSSTAVKKVEKKSTTPSTASVVTPGNSKPMDKSKQSMLNYLVNRSTSPAERVKYFRDRLMKLYGNEKVEQDLSGLPPLMVQALKPPSSQHSNTEVSQPAPPSQSSSYPRQSPGTSTWRSRRGHSGVIPKPAQRVIVHSSVL